MYCHSPICSRACLAGTKELQVGEHSDNGAWGQSVNLGIIYLSVTSIKSWPNPINTLHGAWCWGHGVRKDRGQISIFSIGKFLGEKYGQFGA
jgi:hypothetical protein